MTPARPELCVAAVVVAEGRLLLVRRGRAPAVGRWSVPGGRVEPGETMAEAVVRELAEETGLRGTCGELIGWVERIEPPGQHVIFDFGAEVAPGDPVAGDDAAEVAWVPLADVPAMDLVDGLAEFLAEHEVLPSTT